MPTWEIQSTHRYYREADLVFFECHGLFTLADMQRLLALCDLIEEEFGYVLTGFDTFDGLNLSADARRLAGERSRSHNVPTAAAIVGASFGIRTVSMLINNASRLLGKPVPPAQFFNTVDEALQWLAAQREPCRIEAAKRRRK